MNKSKTLFSFVALALLLSACTGTPKESVVSNVPSTSTTVSSGDPIEPSSSLAVSSTSKEITQNKLYTDSGLEVFFNAKGARIDKINWNGKQIAKDGFTVGRVAKITAIPSMVAEASGMALSPMPTGPKPSKPLIASPSPIIPQIRKPAIQATWI